MRLHGGYPPLRLAVPQPETASAKSAPVTAAAEQPTTPITHGYRNLFGPPDRADLFNGYGFATPHQIGETTRILDAVAYRMGCPYAWPTALAPGVKTWENPHLPSGYVYLAQLVAHDLTFVQSVRPRIRDVPTSERNLRGAGLELDSIYGGSVNERPSAYCFTPLPNSFSHERTRLRLGYYTDKLRTDQLADVDNRLRARDIPRIGPDFRNDAATGLSDTLLVDPRNDDQPIIAQIFVIFALLHNTVCDQLEAADPALTARHGGLVGAARRVTTTIYRAIIEKDLLRHVLNEEVYARYAIAKEPLLDDHGDGRLPLEFSHAAFRFGHAMVRPHYAFSHLTLKEPFGLEDTLRQNSSFRPEEMPLKAIWITQWSHFFALEERRPVNLSRRLGPEMSAVLVDDAKFETISLARRDLLRGASGMRSVDSLIRELEARGVALPEFLQSPARRQDAVRDWLARPFANQHYLKDIPLSDQDRDVIAADPPLLLFILLEAAVTEQGQRLGFLGSVIVAESLFAALRSDAGPSTAPDARELLDVVHAGEVPDSMEKLIHFLEQRYEFARSGVPFV
jgi:hypothetical protein